MNKEATVSGPTFILLIMLTHEYVKQSLGSSDEPILCANTQHDPN